MRINTSANTYTPDRASVSKNIKRKELYCPNLNTNTIVVKITKNEIGFKTMVRFIGSVVININPKVEDKQSTVNVNKHIEKIIDAIHNCKNKYNKPLIDKIDLVVLKQNILDILMGTLEDIEMVFYGTKSIHKYNLMFFNMDELNNSFLDNIPHKMEKDRILIYDLKHRINPIINQIDNYFHSSSVILKPNGTMIDINVVNKLNTKDILKDQISFINKNVFRYIKYNIINQYSGVIMEDKTIDFEQLKINDDNDSISSDDYFRSKTIASNDKELKVYERFKRMYYKNSKDDIVAVVDHIYTVYDRSNKNITKKNLDRVIDLVIEKKPIYLLKEA